MVSNAEGKISPNTEIGSVTLRVSDLERARSFYEKVLGCEVLEETDGSLALGVKPDRVFLNLEDSPGASRPSGATTGLYHFAILVPDRRALAVVLERLVRNEYALQGAADHYVSEAVYLADPEGNGIELYADRPRSDWHTADGQLRMGTAALDVDSLLAAIDDGRPRESRLPEGTRIGHIHLHVADLEDGIRFYRDVIGFDLMMRYGPSAGFLSAGGYHHHIGINTWAGVGAPPPPAGSSGLQHFTIQVADDSDVERIAKQARLAKLEYERQDEVLIIRDPSENRIVITAGEHIN